MRNYELCYALNEAKADTRDWELVSSSVMDLVGVALVLTIKDRGCSTSYSRNLLIRGSRWTAEWDLEIELKCCCWPRLSALSYSFSPSPLYSWLLSSWLTSGQSKLKRMRRNKKMGEMRLLEHSVYFSLFK